MVRSGHVSDDVTALNRCDVCYQAEMKSTLCRAYLNVFNATLDSTFALGLIIKSWENIRWTILIMLQTLYHLSLMTLMRRKLFWNSCNCWLFVSRNKKTVVDVVQNMPLRIWVNLHCLLPLFHDCHITFLIDSSPEEYS